MPCQDPEVHTATTAQKVACEGCEGDGIGDLCTPFCKCQCCSIHYTSYQAGYYSILEPYIAQGKFVFMESQEQEYLHTFLKPPRV